MSDTTIPIPRLDRDEISAVVQVDFGGASEIGRKRSQNQDHYMIAELKRQLSVLSTDVPLESCDALYGSEPGHLLVVADGMGGHCDGEIASSTAVQVCARYVLDMMYWFLKLSAQNEEDFTGELSRSLSSAQEALWSQSESGSNRMGTTVTLAYILWPKMYVIHAGDSRCYVSRDGELKQITTDHTVAQRMIDEKIMTQEEAATSPFSHVLWNCVGGGDHAVRPEVVRYRLRPGDQVLLCSDGLHGMISDEAIATVLNSSPDAAASVKRLLVEANDAGGRDNITAIVGRFERV